MWYYYYEIEENGDVGVVKGDVGVVKGDEKFIQLLLPFKTKDSYDAELYACPKCHTVIMHIQSLIII